MGEVVKDGTVVYKMYIYGEIVYTIIVGKPLLWEQIFKERHI